MNPIVSRTIKIGITGPSNIHNDNTVRERVKKILLKIDEYLSWTPYQLIVISPLAEGADQIVTKEIMKFKASENTLKPSLEIISQRKLNEDSEELNKLINLSTSKRTLNDVLNDEIYKRVANDYTHAGQLVVDKCDCLIAVWDENKSKNGDTASIVGYARVNSIPIFIINPNISEKTREDNTISFWDDLNYLNIYNNENVNTEELNKEINKKEEDLLEKVELKDSEKNLIKNNIIIHLAKANLLSMHYQKWHYRSVNLVYYFSAGAVAIVTLQLLFFPEFPQISVLEAGMMITIILLYYWNKKQKWHRKWIDYRYLAERLRAANIFAISGLDCHVLEHLPHQRSGDDWTLQAYNSIYQKQLISPCNKLDFEQKREFILNNWIED